LTPTYSRYASQKDSFGISFETEYWQTESTGTGIELGTYDFRSTPGQIDHLAVMEDVRLVPWPTKILLNRLAFELKTGAETYFTDGSKDVEVGLGVNVAITTKIKLEASVVEHWRTTSSRDGETARLGIKWKF
jgi:hypothetical protein